jgi:Tfp pilus assembly protein PilF
MEQLASAPLTSIAPKGVTDFNRQAYERAQLFLERNQPANVKALVGPLLSKDFTDPFALELLGHAAYQEGEWGLAANLYKQAYAVRPSPDVLINLGACFKQIDALKEAEETWGLALEAFPNIPSHQRSGLLANIAGCYTANGTPEKAERLYREAVRVDPSNRTAAYNLCWPLLEKRAWAEGWRAYDSGFLCGTRVMRTYDQVPAINVALSPQEMRNAVRGKRVIVWGDQGLGDEIMAAGCIPDLMKDAREVTFDCHPRLRNIFSRSFGIECTGTRKSSNIEWFRGREFDISVPITTLMTMYRSMGEWPGTPYLRPLQTPRSDRLKIGLSWAGGVASTRAHVRSMPLASLQSLLTDNADWVSLQYHESAAPEVCRFEEETGVRLKHSPGALTAEDYDRTAELVSGLDLVITVCTTVMHLAGAMGIPCWVMTPHRAPWVMGVKGENLPMYGSARIFRQTSDEKDWSGVIGRISAAIPEFEATLNRREAAE